MGEHLTTQRLVHGEQILLARAIGVSTRTLRTWSRAGRAGQPGRAPHSDEMRSRARAEVERIWPELPRGHDGWRTVAARLAREEIVVPTRLVQGCVRELKRARRQREHARILERRVHVEVQARDALWALDQTHLGRDERGPVQALAVRECASPLVLAASVGPPPSTADVARLLESAAEKRGAWPLALMLDNGGENRGGELEELLRRQQVIVLWNEPHTPQHNARIERTVGDLKLAAGLDGRASRMADATQGPASPTEPGVARTRSMLCARLVRAWWWLDRCTPRRALEGRTPAEVDRTTPRAEDHVRRARFYEDVCSELERVAQLPIGKRARRKLAREAIWSALQRHGLVKRTRGGHPIPTVKAEGDS